MLKDVEAKQPAVSRDIVVPKVDSIQYTKVIMKMSDGTEKDGYRLVCPCGNCDRDNYGNYVKTVLETDERGKKHSTRVMSLLCNNCYKHDIIYSDFQKEYEKIVKDTNKEIKLKV